MPEPQPTVIRPVRWDDSRLVVIDQRRLPMEYIELTLTSPAEVADAIRTLAVRGAPLIGITAAYGVALAAVNDPEPATTLEAIELLAATRPTARDLFDALEHMRAVVNGPVNVPVGTLRDDELKRLPLAEALAVHQRDLLASGVMRGFAADVFTAPGWVMTICNTGALATGGGGTALGVIIEGYRRGLVEGVYVPETRPLLQGARLTCWELDQLGIPFKLIPDNAAAGCFRAGGITAVITGADRVARNGDAANKLGTRGLAVLAHHHGVQFYIAAPHTTFDGEVADGGGIEIEQRDPAEVRTFNGQPITPDHYPVGNPAFDVTEAGLITGYITDKGLFTPETLGEAKLWT